MRKKPLIILALLWAGTTGLQAQTCNLSIKATTPTAQFSINGDGTVTDSKTGLMWKQCVEGKEGVDCATDTLSSFTWDQALQQPEILNASGGFASHTDWRLPNIKELSSILEMGCYQPAVNLTLFPGDPGSYVWSGSPYAGDAYGAWGVYFYGGDVDDFGRGDYYAVRLVRSGQ